MPSAAARCASACPMRPMPMMPSTLPATSMPSNFDFSHKPARIDSVACTIGRASAKMYAIASSATACVLAPGVFMMRMPLASA